MDMGKGAAEFSQGGAVELAAPVPLTSAEFLTAALMQARVGTWQVDMFTGLTTWDAVASDILGLPAAQMSRTGLLPVHPDDQAAVRERFERHAVVGGADVVEFRITRPDGEIRWLEAKGRRLDETDGTSRYLVGIVTDITERRMAAESLREAEERYRLISQVTTDVIFDWDIKNDRLRWNEAKGAFFGYTSDYLNSMSVLRQKIHPDDHERVVAEFAKLFDGDDAHYASDHRLRNAAGVFLDIHACGSVIRDPDGKAVRIVGSIQDVSERRYADAALRESEAINRGIWRPAQIALSYLILRGGSYSSTSRVA